MQRLDEVARRQWRRRRSDDMRRLRSRRRRRMHLFKVEVGDREIALAMKFAGLRADQADNADAVSAAISRLLSRGLAALLNEEAMRSK